MFDNNSQDASSLHTGSEPAIPVAPPPSVPEPTLPVPTPAAVTDDVLLEIKRQALQNLTPLLHQLDQEPEEKFKTTMMLIQASDNPSLIKQAFEAANQITDEGIKAQALIDIVNEINYFTQQDSKN